MNGLKEKYKNPDWDRIAHLFKIGIFASLLALIGGDMILGWGTVDMSLDGMEQYFSRYTDVSDVRIFWSGLLGMIGITLETMSFFGVYRIDPSRAIEGTIMFAKYFLIPVTVIFFVFFLVMNIVQIMAFAKGQTPYPRWCWIFTMLTGLIDIAAMRLVGNRPWAYALSTGWLSFRSLVTFIGLLVAMPKARN